MARAMRAESERRREGQPPDASADIDTSAAVALLEAADAPVLIHGHTHRPGKHVIEDNGHITTRWVLGDWYETGNYLRVSDTACEAITLA